MLIELAQGQNSPVVEKTGKSCGRVDFFVTDGKLARIAGIQVAKNGVVKKFYGLSYQDVELFSRQAIVIESIEKLTTNLKNLDELFRQYGRLLGVTAKTESGKRIGAVIDAIIEAETGIIIRLVIRNFLQERIIPRQFLVSITPKAIIFQDVVVEPVFDKIATMQPVENNG